MDALTFDGYTSYSDASTPRTPSPTDMPFPPNIKHDIDHPIRGLFNNHPDDDHPAQDAGFWQHNNVYNPRGSLLHELYNEQDAISPDYSDNAFNAQQQQQPQQGHHWDPHSNQNRNDYSMMRRATFPYVRQDREDGAVPLQQYPPFMQQQQQQHHQHQQILHQQHQQQMQQYPSRHDASYAPDAYLPPINSSPHSNYHDFDDHASIKLEDSSAQLMVPSQQAGFYRAHSNSSAGVAGHPMPSLSYLNPHSGLPVQHTDDAASKETQYLRRRCFNCHTTEPPSWRRSTLNPGKIVCNKCGLYERTHLRPRPLRFDELRAGNKARKGGKTANGGVSPKQGKLGMVKREGLVRRSSVSSNSSVHSGSGASDWDDSVSVYSSGSAPPTSFNSPITNNFPLSRDSQSPPRDGGIRLPNNPLSDIASMHIQHPMQQQQQQQQSTTPLMPPSSIPRKSHSSPGGFYSPSLNASSMPPLAENAVWSTEPEDVSHPGLNGGLLPSPELTASS